MKRLKALAFLFVFLVIIFAQSNLAFASSADDTCSVFENLCSSNVSELKYVKDDFVTNSKIYRGNMNGLAVKALVSQSKYTVTAFYIYGKVSDSSPIVEYMSNRFNRKYDYANHPEMGGEIYAWYLDRNNNVTLIKYYDGTMMLALNLNTVRNAE